MRKQFLLTAALIFIGVQTVEMADAAAAAPAPHHAHHAHVRHAASAAAPVPHFKGSAERPFLWQNPGGDPYSLDEKVAQNTREQAFRCMMPTESDEDIGRLMQGTSFAGNFTRITIGMSFTSMVGGMSDGQCNVYTNVKAAFKPLPGQKKNMEQSAPAYVWPAILLSDGSTAYVWRAKVCGNWLILIIPPTAPTDRCKSIHYEWYQGMRSELGYAAPQALPTSAVCIPHLYLLRKDGTRVEIPLQDNWPASQCTFCEAINLDLNGTLHLNVQFQRLFATLEVKESGEYVLDGLPPEVGVPAYRYEFLNCLQDKYGPLQTMTLVIGAGAFYKDAAYAVQPQTRVAPESDYVRLQPPSWWTPPPRTAIVHEFVWRHKRW